MDVIAEGRVVGHQYQNDYFGVTVTAKDGKFTAPSSVKATAQRARLVDAVVDADDWQHKYSVSLLADSLAVNPLVTSPDVYLRKVRYLLERDGGEIVTEELHKDVSGLSFVGSVMKMNDGGRGHFRGLYTAFLRGYIVSLDVTAPSVERLNQILSESITFKKLGF